MASLIGPILSAFLQASVFLGLAGLLWGAALGVARLRGRPPSPFRSWAGLVRGGLGPLALLGLALGGCAYGAAVVLLAGGTGLHTLLMAGPQAELVRELGPLALVAGLFYGFLKTGFSEELIFRGVLGGRLIAAWGLRIGNGLQALVFAGLHSGLVVVGVPDASLGLHGVVFGQTLALAGLAGWLMARPGQGSIAGAVALHGGANLGTVVGLLAVGVPA